MKASRTLQLCCVLLVAGCLEQSHRTSEVPLSSTGTLNDLVIPVSRSENRAVSFTNKRSAYYYTQTHSNDHSEHAWFRGLNIAKRRVFSGYELRVNGVRLNTEDASALVYPDRLERRYPDGTRETLSLFDDQDVIEIRLEGTEGTIAIELLGDQVEVLAPDSGNGLAFFRTTEYEGKVIAVGPIHPTAVNTDQRTVGASAEAGGFYVAVGDSRKDAAALVTAAREHASEWKEARNNRMQELLTQNTFLEANDDTLTSALRWITLNLDQLMTRQQGYGIYAGLPWFNEYWGRDSFIALPGAGLVIGQFEWARNILTSFAEFQDTDPESEFYGRVPNIVNPDNIDYHTTDGTPRFVIQMQQYVQYSGDTTLVHEMYPRVKASIEGALANWVDDDGYLLHADNETWMDARRSHDLVPYSPRGTRANDIQALWYKQLQAGVYFASFEGDAEAAERWVAVAQKVRRNFARDYRAPDQNYLADRLDENDQADFKLRPNQLYAFDLIENDTFKVKATRKVWEELVYPWGVASLDRNDPFFHPYHLRWESYHKDEAYHNGAVWLWNNGMAMQRMIEVGQEDMAYQLFENMSRLALTRGVVGGLPENSDAYPHPGEGWPRLTGTYLQAWSNAEHLRVWYQYFLGIRPDMINRRLTLAPRIPEKINNLEYTFVVGEGSARGRYSKGDEGVSFVYDFRDVSLTVELDVFPFNERSIDVNSGEQIVIDISGDRLELTIFAIDGSIRENGLSEVSPDRRAERRRWSEIMHGVQFCDPLPDSSHPVLLQTFERDQ